MTTRIYEGNPDEWNAFVAKHFPPVGAFLQSYEWGKFKEAFHGKSIRLIVEENDTWLACANIEFHSLPFGFSYCYAPRGPVLHTSVRDNDVKVKEIFSQLTDYLKTKHTDIAFIRFEPALSESPASFSHEPFTLPRYYLQPRFNQVVTLASQEELLGTFSSDIKHDIRAAGRFNITVTSTGDLSRSENMQFEAMKRDTRARSGKDIFPSKRYFELMETIFKEQEDKTRPHIRFFIASNKDGMPVAINICLLFGKTLTYLYGTSYTGSVSKRAPAFLHFKTMEYAEQNGFSYYDLGGIDETLWQGLTYFKRQFGGTTSTYLGIVDVVLQPRKYKLYNRIKHG